MRKLGSYLVIFGIATIVLNFFDMAPKILLWIYDWGDGVAWAIKIGLIVVGAALYFMGGSKKEEEAPEEQVAE